MVTLGPAAAFCPVSSQSSGSATNTLFSSILAKKRAQGTGVATRPPHASVPRSHQPGPLAPGQPRQRPLPQKALSLEASVC